MIEVDKLTKFYGETRALDGVSFEVPRGQIVGFLGPNGAGKTTCMKILTGFISPTAGTARMGGFDVVEQSLQARELIGYLPEDRPLYHDMGVIDYLRYVAELRSIPPEQHDRQIRYVVETCGLKEMAGRVIGTLSKGYRQRVGLAQALIHTPDILILDEPTDGLDPNQADEIRALIRDIGQDRTVMLSTHHLSEVKSICDRVLIVHQGQVVVDKRMEELQGNMFRVEVASTNGTAPDGLAPKLSALPDVSEVRAAESDDSGVAGFDIDVSGERDIRTDLFHLAVDNKWTLRELHRSQEQLEEVFRRVTTA